MKNTDVFDRNDVHFFLHIEKVMPVTNISHNDIFFYMDHNVQKTIRSGGDISNDFNRGNCYSLQNVLS